MKGMHIAYGIISLGFASVCFSLLNVTDSVTNLQGCIVGGEGGYIEKSEVTNCAKVFSKSAKITKDADGYNARIGAVPTDHTSLMHLYKTLKDNNAQLPPDFEAWWNELATSKI